MSVWGSMNYQPVNDESRESSPEPKSTYHLELEIEELALQLERSQEKNEFLSGENKSLSEKNECLLAQALALKAINTELERELDKVKSQFNKLDDEYADLFNAYISKSTAQASIEYEPTVPPSVPSVGFGFDLKAYADSIQKLCDNAAHGRPRREHISRRLEILTEEEKFELRVQRVLLVRDAMKNRISRNPEIGYFDIGDIKTDQDLINII
ncbi:hypothetical protein EV361DRAFT_943395 [Lentinula raphanica]|nr:hypothetical protein EV361DRAFT_943395 [Lentinula raphanica]